MSRLNVAMVLAGLVALAAVFSAPSWLLLAGAVVLFRSVSRGLIGKLTAADILIIFYIVKTILVTRRWPVSRELRPLGLLLVIAWTSTMLAGVSTTPLMRITLYSAVSFGIAADTAFRRQSFYISLTIYSAVVVALSIPQATSRMVGVGIGDPQQLGILLLAALAPLMSAEVRFPGSRFCTYLLWFGVLATRTRGVWLAAVFMCGLIVSRHLSRRQTLGLAAGILALGLVLYGPATERLGLNASSSTYRAESITRGLRVFAANPVLGVGWAGLSDARLPTLRTQLVIPYNVLVLMGVNTGVVGVLCFCKYVWRLIGRIVTFHDRSALLFVAPFLLLSMSEPTFYAGSLATLLFFVYAGLGISRTRDSGPTVGSEMVLGTPPGKGGAARTNYARKALGTRGGRRGHGA